MRTRSKPGDIGTAIVFALALVAGSGGAPAARAEVGRVAPGDGPTGPPPFVLAQGLGERGGAVFLSDLAADGSPALVVSGTRGRTPIYRVPTERGLKAFRRERLVADLGGKGAQLALCDASGDGRPLLCAIGADGTLWIARRREDGTYAASKLGPAPRGERLLAGDVDGDRLEDLVVLWRIHAPPGAGGTSSDGSAGRSEPPAQTKPGRVVALLLRATGRGEVFDPPVLFAQDIPTDARLADLDGDGRQELCWLEGRALMARAPVRGGFARRLVARGVEGPILAAADLSGDGRADLVVPGAWLVRTAWGFERLRDPRLDAVWDSAHGRVRGLLCTGDLDGDGRADLLHLPLTGRRDVRVLLSRPKGYYQDRGWPRADTDHDGLCDLEELLVYGTDPLRRDTDRDGLLDGFEVKGFRGVDLRRLGAAPRHRDIFLELDVQQGASMARVRRAIRRTEALYADAPLENPDGERGIRLHCLVDTRVPRWPGKTPHRHTVRELFFTPRRAGLFHWMFLGATGGGGQADLLSDQGGCAGAFEATLPHEFGHQLGLRHGGTTGMNGIPIYPSLMNYAYNYQLGGRRDRIRYSDGALAGTELDERALPERVAVPPERLRFLSGPPFFFRLEGREPAARERAAGPAPDDRDPAGAPAAKPAAPRHRATWIDWDRDGIEDEEPVRANINAAAGEGYGPRSILDRDHPKKGQRPTASKKACAMVVVCEKPSTGDRDQTEKDPDREAARLVLLYLDAGTDRPMARVLQGDDLKALGPPLELAPVTGLDHLSAVADRGEVRLFASRGEEVVELRGTPEQRPWTLHVVKPALASWAAGARVPAVTLAKRAEGKGSELWLALSDPKTQRVWLGRERRHAPEARPDRPEDRAASEFEGRVLPELRSETPVDLAWDSVRKELLLACTQTQARTERNRTVKRRYRLRLARIRPENVAVRTVEWVGGERASDATSRRPELLFESASWLPQAGRVDIFHAGILDAPRPNRHMYRSYTIGDKAWRGRGGWKEDQTWNEWSYALQRPAVAWYRGRPWHLVPYPHCKGPDRWSDHLVLAPHADGVCDRGLRDTNDWEIIDRTGLWRSILQIAVPKGRRP